MRRHGARLTATAAILLLGLSLAGATSAAGAATPSAGSEDTGVPERVVVKGLCQGQGSYTLTVRNAEKSTTARLLADGLQPNADWSGATEARTALADGSNVAGVGDFFELTTDDHGRLDVSAATPFGLSRSFTFSFSQSDGQASCQVSVAIGSTTAAPGTRSGVRAPVTVHGLCARHARYRATLANASDPGVQGDLAVRRAGRATDWSGREGSSTSVPRSTVTGVASVEVRSHDGRFERSQGFTRGTRNRVFYRLTSEHGDSCRSSISS